MWTESKSEIPVHYCLLLVHLTADPVKTVHVRQAVPHLTSHSYITVLVVAADDFHATIV